MVIKSRFTTEVIIFVLRLLPQRPTKAEPYEKNDSGPAPCGVLRGPCVGRLFGKLAAVSWSASQRREFQE